MGQKSRTLKRAMEIRIWKLHESLTRSQTNRSSLTCNFPQSIWLWISFLADIWRTFAQNAGRSYHPASGGPESVLGPVWPCHRWNLNTPYGVLTQTPIRSVWQFAKQRNLQTISSSLSSAYQVEQRPSLNTAGRNSLRYCIQYNELCWLKTNVR